MSSDRPALLIAGVVIGSLGVLAVLARRVLARLNKRAADRLHATTYGSRAKDTAAFGQAGIAAIVIGLAMVAAGLITH